MEKPPIGAYGFELANILADLIQDFARGRGLGRAFVEMLFDVRPAVNRSRRPDVAFVSAATWPVDRRAPKTAAWAVVPDLAVEILGPTNSASAVAGKVREYFQAGVKLVWVVYPDQDEVYVHDSPKAVTILGRGDSLDGGAVLPGFVLGVDDLFGPPSA